MNHVLLLGRFSLLALLLAAGPAALAQTCTRSWAAPVDGSWSVAANWTPAEVPTSGDVVCIDAVGTYTVSIGDFVSVAAGTLILGGASGIQTLTSRGFIGIESAEIRPNGRLALLDISPGGEDGLYATGTVLVEGEVSVPSGVSFLRTGGTLDVAPSGTFRVSGQASVGDPSALFRIRGTVEGVGCPFPINTGQCTIRAPVEVLGGTLRAASGVLVLQAGGTMNGATLDAGPVASLILNADLVPPHRMTVQGLIQGSPQGTVGMSGLNLFAGPAGATLAVNGTGFQMVGTSFLRSGGGSFTNTGLLLKAATGSNFSGIAEAIVRNEGVVEIPSSLGLYAGSVLRNEPGGVVRATGGGRLAGDGNGTGRFENAGLFVLDAPGQSFGFGDGGFGNNSGPYSQPGSELRVLAGTLDLIGPGSRTLPDGVAVTGDGTVGIPLALEPEGTLSPGTAAQPLATLTVASYFRPSLVAGSPRLVIDVDAGGQSDRLDVLFAPGSQNTRLGGALVVRVRPGYTPAIGDAFTILTSGSAIEGQFAQVVADGAPDGIAFVPEVSADGLTLTLRAVAVAPDGPITVSTTTPVGGAVRPIFLTGPGASGVSAARLECTECLDPAAFGTIPAQIVGTGTLKEARFDLTSPRAYGFYDLILQRPGQPDEVVPITVRPYLAFVFAENGIARGALVRPSGLGYNYSLLQMDLRTNADEPAYHVPRVVRTEPDVFALALASGNPFGGGVVYYESDEAADSERAPLTFGRLTRGMSTPLTFGLRIDPEDVLFPEQTPTGPDDPRVPFGAPRLVTAAGAQHLSSARTVAALGTALRQSASQSLTSYLAAVDAVDAAAVTLATRNVIQFNSRGYYAAPADVLARLIDAFAATVEPPPGLAASAAEAFDLALESVIDDVAFDIEVALIEPGGAVGALVQDEIAALFPEGTGLGDDFPDAIGTDADALRTDFTALERLFCFLGFGDAIRAIKGIPGGKPGGGGGGACQPPAAPADPNDKFAESNLTCEFGTVIVDGEEQTRCVRYYVPLDAADDPLFYTVTFENIAGATANAEFVTITDEIDPNLNLATLAIEGTSSDSTFSYSVSGRTVTFRFVGIDLPPNVTPPEGEGFVKFSLVPNAGLEEGTEIRNDAEIVFDFNPPIFTPEVLHEIRPTADLAALVTAPDFSEIGSTVTFIATAANLRGDVAGETTLTISPPDVPVVSVTTPVGECTGTAPIVCTLGDLLQGEIVSVEVVVDPEGKGDLTLSAAATTTAFDGFEPNNADAVTVSVVPVGNEDEDSVFPREVTLAQPYPNPSRGEATFRWGLPEAGRVTIQVYDLLGREVAQLADGAVTEPGWHEVRWRGAVASGVYVVRMKAEAGRQTVVRTRRIVVVR